MPKAVQIGLWCTIVGIALTVQGCWDDPHEKLTFIGEGGCRTADGSEGQYTTVAAASADECEAQCFSAETTCKAIEYNSVYNVCEVHDRPITDYAQYAGVSCYAMK
jgi:PAN domain